MTVSTHYLEHQFSTGMGITMSKAAVLSPYENRVELVQSVVSENTKLDKKASRALSVSILLVLDQIPEKVR